MPQAPKKTRSKKPLNPFKMVKIQRQQLRYYKQCERVVNAVDYSLASSGETLMISHRALKLLFKAMKEVEPLEREVWNG